MDCFWSDVYTLTVFALFSRNISLWWFLLFHIIWKRPQTRGLGVNDLHSSVAAARSKGITVWARVIVNPGNPIGQCLSEANSKEISYCCHQEESVLLGDEVDAVKEAPESKRSSKPSRVGGVLSYCDWKLCWKELYPKRMAIHGKELLPHSQVSAFSPEDLHWSSRLYVW